MEKRKIDIVFCIDGTRSMTPCLESVKAATKTFTSKFKRAMEEKQSEVELLRIKIITFRDYECDSEPMVESPFYEMPDDVRDLEEHLNTIKPLGGGDDAENGMEALAYAMNSDFIARGPKDRQVIVLLTDSDCHKLQERKNSPNYPSKMDTDESLLRKWYLRDQSCKLGVGKRLLLYAPAGSKYEELRNTYKGTGFVAVNASSGLKEFEFDGIIKIIAASASAEY